MNRPTLKQLRKESATFKKSNDVKTHQAQKAIAQKYGFKDWRSAVKELDSSSLILSLPKFELPDSLSNYSLINPTLSFTNESQMIIVGKPGTNKTLLLKETALQALQQGHTVIYVGFYPNHPIYDTVNYDPKIESFETFHPYQIERVDLTEIKQLNDESDSKVVLLVDEPQILGDVLVPLLEMPVTKIIAVQDLRDLDVKPSGRVYTDIVKGSIMLLGHNDHIMEQVMLCLERIKGDFERSFVERALHVFGYVVRESNADLWIGDSEMSVFPRGKSLVDKLNN